LAVIGSYRLNHGDPILLPAVRSKIPSRSF